MTAKLTVQVKVQTQLDLFVNKIYIENMFVAFVCIAKNVDCWKYMYNIYVCVCANVWHLAKNVLFLNVVAMLVGVAFSYLISGENSL